MDKELLRVTADYRGKRKHDPESTRQQEMEADFKAFIGKYISAADNKAVIYDLAVIERDFGLQPGSIQALITQMAQHFYTAEASVANQGIMMLCILWGLYHGDTRYTHVESLPMEVAK